MPGVLTQTTPFKTITVKELHPTFGAEVSGVDFENSTDEQFDEIVAAMAKYGFCVFRSTPLTDATHVSFSRRFGSLDNIARFLTPGRALRYEHLELFDASNLDTSGAILPANSPRAHSSRGNRLFHTDSSFNPRRASFSLLRAVELPPPETGGNTDFADSRTAWDRLPDDMKAELLRDDWTGAFSMAHSRKLGSPEFFADMDPVEAAPMARHKIVQVHEASGRVGLYVGAHLHHLEGEGMSAERSKALVEFLNAWCQRKEFVVSVKWEREGDLVIWDNRAVLHRAGEWSGDGVFRRDMRRTTVHDDGERAWGENVVDTEMPNINAWIAKKAAVGEVKVA
ncbi:alpha-ketoglutarate-dependent 2,4-dichlorophenoxyacetate dioxygenase [Cercophora scortea]|uniref:Alpha-ketoglutarate-dependent 2,4-dichlorophenoxyacetate dioxygenase n=1 Tax=Cercophora scortea TaxID=314031 RepID=A0AAE0M6Q5_9PEZI|nr:alpha-ketoglutarate-dependent 2,4-dichlorophenoxyacetate dioxygenase [Cercophora scortea]